MGDVAFSTPGNEDLCAQTPISLQKEDRATSRCGPPGGNYACPSPSHDHDVILGNRHEVKVHNADLDCESDPRPTCFLLAVHVSLF